VLVAQFTTDPVNFNAYLNLLTVGRLLFFEVVYLILTAILNTGNTPKEVFSKINQAAENFKHLLFPETGKPDFRTTEDRLKDIAQKLSTLPKTIKVKSDLTYKK